MRSQPRGNRFVVFSVTPSFREPSDRDGRKGCGRRDVRGYVGIPDLLDQLMRALDPNEGVVLFAGDDRGENQVVERHDLEIRIVDPYHER